MISTNVNASSIIVPLGKVEAQELTAAADSTAFVKVDKYHKYAVVVQLGAVAATGVVEVTAVQSKVSAGTDPVELTVNGGEAKVSFDDGDDGSSAVIDLDPVNFADGYAYVSVTVTETTAATAASVSATLIGVGPKYETGRAPSTV